MFIKNKKIFSYFICIFFFTKIHTSQDPITTSNIIPKIESWVSINSDSSWENIKSLFEQMKILAENNSFFENDEDEDDNSDDENSNNDADNDLYDTQSDSDNENINDVINLYSHQHHDIK